MPIPSPITVKLTRSIEPPESPFNQRRWCEYIGDACDLDIDNDNVVNALDVCDFTPLGSIAQPDGSLRADADGDCDVDLADWSIMQLEFTGPAIRQ